MYEEWNWVGSIPKTITHSVIASPSPARAFVEEKMLRLVAPPEHKTRDPKFERPGRMLDIGCGAGWFIFQMKRQGWDVKGVEPNVNAAKFGRSKKNLDIFPG